MEFRDLKRQYDVLKEEIDKNISKVINSSNFISGREIKQLEETLAGYVGVDHCISCANGTDALTVSLMAWGLNKNDAVFVPDFTFFSSGESPVSLGFPTFFVDVDRRSYNIDPNALEKVIQRVIGSGKYNPRVVIAVDLFGQPADYERIRKICNKYNMYILEDGAQGFGGKIREKRVCSFGDISTTSFFPAKPLGCYGDGGAIFTNNSDWASLIRSICIHGKNAEDKYDNIRIGMNSRLDTIQAAILNAKFGHFKDYEIDQVNKIADLYSKLLDNCGLTLPFIKEGVSSSWAQYTVQLPEKVDRNDVQEYMKQNGIPTMIYYKKPMHMQGAFKGTVSEDADCPITETLCGRVLSLPIHPYIERKDVEFICRKLKESIEESR